MRLTNKETKIKLSDTKRYDLQDHKMFTKLSQLEDIEDAWGMELTTLIDMIENETRIWYRHTGFMGITEILEGEIEAVSKNGELFIKTFFSRNQKDFFDFMNNHYYAKDYGKTWALTKEELE